MRIDLIVNVQARKYQQDPNLLDRVSAAAEGRCHLHVTHDLSELDGVASELGRGGTDLVVLSGGDGSLMAGVTALARAFGESDLPLVAPIAGGTVGTVARNWGVRGDPVTCLNAVLAAPRRYRRTPTLRATGHGEAEREEQRIGFIVGTGLVAQFFEVYYERGAPGYGGSALIVARVFAESFVGGAFARRVLDPLPCALVVEGQPLEPQAWSLICAAVVPNLGIHMLVNYRAAEDPDRPHLVANPLPAGRLGPRAPLVLAGRNIGGRGHFDGLVREFAIEFPSVGPYVLDGELLSASRVTVSAGPLVRMVTP